MAPHGAATRYDERRPVFLTDPRGLSAWARESQAPVARPGSPTAARAASKRVRDAEADMAEAEPAVDKDGGRSKRDGASSAPAPGEPSPAAGTMESAPSVVAPEAQLPDGCLVYIPSALQTPLLNEVVTVIGTLSTLPELAAAEFAGEAEDLIAAHPPTSRCPRVHAISVAAAGETGPAGPALETPALVEQARAGLLAFLQRCLGGDSLAAEYLLLQLVGRVATRQENTGLVGLLSLNLTQAPAAAATPAGPLSPQGQAIRDALEAVAPRVVPLSLDIKELSARPWWPMRHQTTERLLPGRLQLAKGTQVLVDESVMTAGMLSEVAIRNLQAVEGLIRSQKVSYGFEFFELEQEADAPVTVLSCGRSMLKDAIALWLPLEASSPEPTAGVLADVAGQLPLFRAFLAHARGLDFSIPSSMTETVEKVWAAANELENRRAARCAAASAAVAR
ncbi:hypothetical protein QBZ16_001355 [Prototheca wickerhamii]|uniref:Uncharacterized protein n=1 Tax=Prototheca wickerhamii TaxID=3111 RepID=A0AAD9MG41_PROWI|nr:hypothetical protein QBZ16_001355 [Prototheca wickerhamii]